MLAEEHLTRQVAEEMAAFQAIHHRSLHLAQVQADARIVQPRVDRLQGFQRRQIDFVHCWKHQHYVSQLGFVSDVA